jgi:hypothetical protein
MAYEGIEADIRIGRGGLMTDMNPSDIPDTHLIRAKNIDIQDGIIQKDFGSRKWNMNALSSGIIALKDWFPSESVQRFISVTRAGKVYKHPDSETNTEITASGSAPTSLLITPQIQPQIVTGGNESPGDARKFFIFTGNSPVQVVSGDASIRTDISGPTADWTAGTHPRGGVVHRSRLWAFLDHRVYASDDDDHEQFASGGLQFPVYPGEGERLVSATVYKGKLFLFKMPFGVYMLVDDDVSSSNWYFTKLSDEVGGTGPDAQITALDDFLIANSTGTVTSYQAVQQLGEVESGDIFSLLKCENYVRQIISADGTDERRAVFYAEKKIAYFAARSAGGLRNDRIFKIDLSTQRPQLIIIEKDQPNCFALRQVLNKKKPFYGAENGFIYEMDRQDRNVGGSTAYEMDFQTPHLNFGYIDPKLASIDKLFDFLQIEFIPTGRFDAVIDYYIDGMYVETITVELAAGPVLDDFELDTDRLTANSARYITKKLCGSGKTISFRFRNGELNENLKITGLKALFRPAGNNNKGPNSGRAT